MIDRDVLSRCAATAARALSVDQTILVGREPDNDSLRIAAAGYAGASGMAELALDLLRAGECMLPDGVHVEVRGGAYSLRIEGAQVFEVQRRVVKGGLDG